MKARIRSIGVAVVILLAVVGLLLESDGREATLTTFGTDRRGYKALYDLLNELDIRAPRSYTAPSELPAGATVWWLHASHSPFEENSGPCDASKDEEKKARPWPGKEWLAAGGTAVVFPATGRHAGCESVAGVALPARQTFDDEGNPLTEKEATKLSRRRLRNPFRYQVVSHEQERVVRTYSLQAFDDSGDWTVVAWIGERPFILERSIERGRLVVVADATPLQNAWLAAADAAPLALDLVRRYGAPLLDENAHGFRPSQNVVAYLVESPAIWVLVGLCLLGSLIVWRGSLVPGRAFETTQPPAPALDSYVTSLAGWYARTSDYGSVAERYRQYALARLRRQLHLPAETPLQMVAERLESKAPLNKSMHSTLLQPATAANRDELFATAVVLDAMIRSGGSTQGQPS